MRIEKVAVATFVGRGQLMQGRILADDWRSAEDSTVGIEHNPLGQCRIHRVVTRWSTSESGSQSRKRGKGEDLYRVE